VYRQAFTTSKASGSPTCFLNKFKELTHGLAGFFIYHPKNSSIQPLPFRAMFHWDFQQLTARLRHGADDYFLHHDRTGRWGESDVEARVPESPLARGASRDLRSMSPDHILGPVNFQKSDRGGPNQSLIFYGPPGTGKTLAGQVMRPTKSNSAVERGESNVRNARVLRPRLTDWRQGPFDVLHRQDPRFTKAQQVSCCGCRRRGGAAIGATTHNPFFLSLAAGIASQIFELRPCE